MQNVKLNECLANKYGSYINPLVWFSNESKERVEKEILGVKSAGIREFIFENRGGDWFGTDEWWDKLRFVLEVAKREGMRVWLLDDSHVNTGSANDTLKRPENAQYRPVNARLEVVDLAGPMTAGALLLPQMTANEEILSVTAYRRDEHTGHGLDNTFITLDKDFTDGLCFIDLPEGLWRICFVLTTDTAKAGMFGNYISMVSEASCRHLINEVHEKVYANVPEYFGNTFAGFFSDEPAFGNCDGTYGPEYCNHRMGQLKRFYPWTDDMIDALAARIGATPEKTWEYLPALWCDIDGVSSWLRVAYMDEITYRWEKNFSRQLGDWCREHNVEYIGHNLEDASAHFHTGWGCGHFFRSVRGQDKSGIDVVLNQIVPGINFVNYTSCNSKKEFQGAFYHYTLPKLGSSMAHITPSMGNKSICEVFGAYGWTCGLSVMKTIFDNFLISGINNYMPHAFSMNVPGVAAVADGEGAPPGYCLTRMPPTFFFNNMNPQYKMFGTLLGYVQRNCHILNSGIHQPDAAIYYNAEADWAGCEVRTLDEVTMRIGTLNLDYDLLPAEAFDEARVEAGEIVIQNEHYPVLFVPGAKTMPAKLLQKFDQLASNGAKVVFTDVWPVANENTVVPVNHCQMVAFEDLPSYAAENLTPAMKLDQPFDALRHFRLQDADGSWWCGFENPSARTVDTLVTLPCTGSAAIYDPWQNKLYRPQLQDGKLRLKLFSRQMLWFTSTDQADLPDFPYDTETAAVLDMEFDIYCKDWVNGGDFKFLKRARGTENLTASEGLTRFCGEFRYDGEFECADTDVDILTLSAAGDGAELWLNGEYCGAAVGPVCRFEIVGKLRSGSNKIQILTADNPAYFDRQTDSPARYGEKLPLMPHGICCNVELSKSC